MKQEVRTISKEYAKVPDEINTIKDEIEYIKTSKVNENVFIKQIRLFEQEQIKFNKRLHQDELEKRQFGNFFIRYLPVMI